LDTPQAFGIAVLFEIDELDEPARGGCLAGRNDLVFADREGLASLMGTASRDDGGQLACDRAHWVLGVSRQRVACSA
jgi:hypothetical protein